MSAFVISQVLIGIAFLFDLASFQLKKREYTLICFTIAASLISVHFFLLGAVTAGFVVAVSAVRFLVSIFTTDKRMKYLFLAAIFLLGVWTYDSFEDPLITIAMLFSTIAAFSVDEKRLRQFMMVGSVLVITHNIIILTPAGIALEIFFLGSNLLSYWRFYILKHTVQTE
jgi:hypothetical protein